MTTNKHRRHPLRPDKITFVTDGPVGRGPFRFPIPTSCHIDEIVISDWLHIEVLDYRAVHVQIGDRCLTVHIPYNKDRPIKVTEID